MPTNLLKASIAMNHKGFLVQKEKYLTLCHLCLQFSS